MIVTRQRKVKRSSLPILLPLAAIAMLAIALTWPPSRRIIVDGPLHPVWTQVATVWSVGTRPLTFAAQQQRITDQNIENRRLQDKLEADRKEKETKDAQVDALQKQIAAAAAVPSPEASQAASPSAAASAGVLGATAGAAPVNEGIRRTAAQWQAMDPEKAAGLVAKVPEEYAATVFAQMSPDAVGAVLDALPSATAARIVQIGSGAQVPPETRR